MIYKSLDLHQESTVDVQVMIQHNRKILKASFILAIFSRFSSTCDRFEIDFPIGSNTHFIAKQSQEGRKIASINGAIDLLPIRK